MGLQALGKMVATYGDDLAKALKKGADKADDVTYEIEKFLNYNNNSLTIRSKLAYILFVRGEKECFEQFYKKGYREANRCQIKGLAIFEKKLLDRIKTKLD